jgi:hypothetical protein
VLPVHDSKNRCRVESHRVSRFDPVDVVSGIVTVVFDIVGKRNLSCHWNPKVSARISRSLHHLAPVHDHCTKNFLTEFERKFSRTPSLRRIKQKPSESDLGVTLAGTTPCIISTPGLPVQEHIAAEPERNANMEIDCQPLDLFYGGAFNQKPSIQRISPFARVGSAVSVWFQSASTHLLSCMNGNDSYNEDIPSNNSTAALHDGIPGSHFYESFDDYGDENDDQSLPSLPSIC